MVRERERDGGNQAKGVEPFWEQRTEREKGVRGWDTLHDPRQPMNVAAGAYSMPGRDQSEPQLGVKADPDSAGFQRPWSTQLGDHISVHRNRMSPGPTHPLWSVPALAQPIKAMEKLRLTPVYQSLPLHHSHPYPPVCTSPDQHPRVRGRT